MATPSLRARLTQGFWVLVQLAIGGSLGVGLGTWLVRTSLPLPGLLLALVVVLATVVHEGGHWLGSRLAGMRCYTVAVLWLRLEREPAGWQLRAGQRRPGALGYVRALPAHAEGLRRQLTLFVAGGPVASVVAGALALGAGWGLRHYYPYYRPGAGWGYPGAELAWVFGAWSLLTGVRNAIPSTTRLGNVTDGEHLRRLHQGGPEADRELVLMQLGSHTAQGHRPGTWDAALLGQLLAAPPASRHYCTAHLLAYAHHLDRAELPAARQHLAQACAARHTALPALQRHLCTEAAYVALLHEGTPAEVAEWLTAAEAVKMPKAAEPNDFGRALAACHAADWPRARQHLHTCGRHLAKVADAGLRAQGADRLRQVQDFVDYQASQVSKAGASPAPY